MKHDYDAKHLNVEAFARSGGKMISSERLDRFSRLLEEAQGLTPETLVRYSAVGVIRLDGAPNAQVWIQLAAEVVLPLTCQRCLGLADLPVRFEREFRFVETEAVAAVEDEVSEEDVLVLTRDFNLLELIEDELLMALPVVPKHLVCPDRVKLQVADTDFVEEAAEKPNPFAVLQQLKKKS